MKEEKKVFNKLVREINKPFKEYDIKDYDQLAIHGDTFPITQLAHGVHMYP